MTGRRTRRAARRVAVRRAGVAALLGAALAMAGAGGDAEADDCLVALVPDCGPPPTTTTVPQAGAPPTTTSTTAPPPPTTTSTTSTTSTTVLTPPAAAARLLELVNRDRTNAGLSPLAARADVTDVAQAWSGELARRGQLAHNDDYFTRATRQRLGAKALGENVAYAGDPDTAHRVLMNSTGHRANILDRRFLIVGIGAVLRDGRWWFTQDFLEPVAAPAPDRAAPRPAPPAVSPSDGGASRGASAPRGGGAAGSPAPEEVVSAGAPVADALGGADALDASTDGPAGGDGRPGAAGPVPDDHSTGRWGLLAALAVSAPALVLAARLRARASGLRAAAAPHVEHRSPDVSPASASLRHQVAVIEALTAVRHGGRP